MNYAQMCLTIDADSSTKKGVVLKPKTGFEIW